MTKHYPPIPCPKCGTSLRQQVYLVVDCPTGQRALDKAASRSKRVQIVAALWGSAIVYCPQCSFIYRPNSKEYSNESDSED